MKKAIIVLAFLLVPVMTFALVPGGKISKIKVSSLVSQYRGKQGVEVIEIGRLGTALLKGVAAMADGNDKDTREALTALKGIKGLTIISYEDAEAVLKQKINGKVECTVSDIKRFQKLLHLTDDEILVIFFGKKVDE